VNSLERVDVNWELARTAESRLRPDDRYDALVLIQQYRIHQAAPALRRALRRPEHLTHDETTWIHQIITVIEPHIGEAPRGYATFDPPVPPRPTP